MGGYPRARSEGIVTEEVGDELLIYDERMKAAHCLSADAALVWGRCDGHSSAKEIARRLGLERARVTQALEELSVAGLIEEPEGISRRALYKRTAKLGAAALSAPLIYSVAIRPASAHATSAAACGNFLHSACTVLWNTRDCSGPPEIDGCTLGSGSATCTCQNLGPCVFSGTVSARSGTCA